MKELNLFENYSRFAWKNPLKSLDYTLIEWADMENTITFVFIHEKTVKSVMSIGVVKILARLNIVNFGAHTHKTYQCVHQSLISFIVPNFCAH